METWFSSILWGKIKKFKLQQHSSNKLPPLPGIGVASELSVGSTGFLQAWGGLTWRKSDHKLWSWGEKYFSKGIWNDLTFLICLCQMSKFKISTYEYSFGNIRKKCHFFQCSVNGFLLRCMLIIISGDCGCWCVCVHACPRACTCTCTHLGV